MRVAVIGGGAAGICAVRHLAQSSGICPTVFEQTSCVGGTWVYQEHTGLDNRGEPVHSSMYKNLKTNLPKELMMFPGIPFNPSNNSFIHHSQVLEYLEENVERFGLEKYIKFDTKVVRIKPLNIQQNGKRSLEKGNGEPGEGKEQAELENGNWEVEYKCLKTDILSKELFDKIVVCNGHYAKPIYPNIEGQEKFCGKIIHSHDYRDPESFRGENVVVLGAAASGTDIAVELCSTANQVYLSHNHLLITAKLPANLAQIRGIERCIGSSGFLLTDGSRVQCDSVVLATGYNFSFPFLTEDCNVFVENNQVKGLFKHLVNIEHPTMALLGIPCKVVPFPLFDIQMKFLMKLFQGEINLPTKEEMYEDTRKEKEWRKQLGQRDKDFHQMGSLQWPYIDELAKMAGIETLDPVYQNMYSDAHEERCADLTSYKNNSYQIIDQSQFKKIIPTK